MATESKKARVTSRAFASDIMSGCSKAVRSSHPQQAPRRRSTATPHTAACEDGGEMAAFQQPVLLQEFGRHLCLPRPPLKFFQPFSQLQDAPFHVANGKLQGKIFIA